MRQTDGMTGQLRLVSIAIALFYFGVSIYHFWRASGIEPAVIAEAILGLVMTAGVVGLIRSPVVTYVLMLAGTLFGLTIVTLVGGPFTVDFWIHIVMLAGLALGFALILGPRGRTRSI
jgi:hypothetical protein